MGEQGLWRRLEALADGEKILYVTPSLDTDDEVWFRDGSYALRMWRRGTTYRGDVDFPAEVPRERLVLYHYRRELFVEVCTYTDQVIVVLAANNGPSISVSIDESDIAAWVDHYQRLGFRRIGPWHISPSQILWREYRGPGKVVVYVDGTTVSTPSGDVELETREAAEARAEAEVAAMLDKGFWLHLIEYANPRRENPAELSPVSVPELAPLPTPTSAHEAVDLAIARLREVHTRLPKMHLVAELLSLPADDERLAEVTSHAEFFRDLHEDRIGRWLEPAEVAAATSSFDYFAKRYGSLTWVVSSTPRHHGSQVACFYCGNVTGGGWSPLEIRAHEYDTKLLAEECEDPELEKLHVFHGGWHDGKSFAFDTRFHSDDGEEPIIP